MQQPDQPLTHTELARLVIYRAAVKAGFYSDQERPTNARNRATLGAPVRAAGREGVSATSWPFSAAELTRLVAYRTAVAAGLYSEHIQKGDHA